MSRRWSVYTRLSVEHPKCLIGRAHKHDDSERIVIKLWALPVNGHIWLEEEE